MLFHSKRVMWKTFFSAFDKLWYKIVYNKEILRTTIATKDMLEKIQLTYLSKKRMSSFWKRELKVIISQLDITLILQIVKARYKQEVTVFPELVQETWSKTIDLNSK